MKPDTHNRQSKIQVLAILLFMLIPVNQVFADISPADSRPNILIILADDLGYSDIGAYGGEIETPNIDALAERGVQFTNFYAGPTCGPARSMLLSGTDNHLAGLAVNEASLIRMPHLKGRPGYEGHLSKRVVTFARLLQDTGYFTAMAGKWDLGDKAGLRPVDRGFERSFTLMEGGASHFADGAGILSPKPNATYYEDTVLVKELPDDFYSSEFYSSRIIDYLQGNESSGKPFMAYLAYTAPHWPLHAPDGWIDKYRGRYDRGWDVLREERIVRMKSLGLITGNIELPERLRNSKPWNRLTTTARKVEARKMEIYAAMISNMDHHIGRVMAYLRESGQLDNTLIIFLSDNGAEGNDISGIPVAEYWIPAYFDNRYDNIGRAQSYTFMHSGWAQVSSLPRRLYKSFPTNGGIGVPAIVSLPGIQTRSGRSDAVATIMDIAPTLLEAAGTQHPGGRYMESPVLPLRGRSMLPFLQGNVDYIHGSRQALGWETYGNRALRQGDWKILLVWPPFGPGKWQLFNVAEDPGETNDLASIHPDRLNEMVGLWRNYVDEVGLVELEQDTGYGR